MHITIFKHVIPYFTSISHKIYCQLIHRCRSDALLHSIKPVFTSWTAIILIFLDVRTQDLYCIWKAGIHVSIRLRLNQMGYETRWRYSVTISDNVTSYHFKYFIIMWTILVPSTSQHTFFLA